jgi:aspartate carbamoyltransferase regulatory subunit
MKGNENNQFVPPIRYGIVINHLPPGTADYAKRFLKLGNLSRIVLEHVDSTKYGKKDMIKISLTEEQVKEGELESLVKHVKQNDGKLGLISHKITIYYINNQDIAERWHPTVPEYIESLVKCQNPNCLTQVDRHSKPYFHVVSTEPLVLSCQYCERSMNHKEVLESIV